MEFERQSGPLDLDEGAPQVSRQPGDVAARAFRLRTDARSSLAKEDFCTGDRAEWTGLIALKDVAGPGPRDEIHSDSLLLFQPYSLDCAMALGGPNNGRPRQRRHQSA